MYPLLHYAKGEKFMYYAGLLAPFIWIALLLALEWLFSTFLHPNTALIISIQALVFPIALCLLLLNLIQSFLKFNKQRKTFYAKDERIHPPAILFTDWFLMKLHKHCLHFYETMDTLYRVRISEIKKREQDLIRADMKQLDFLPEAIDDVLALADSITSYPTPLKLYACELSTQSTLQRKVTYLEMPDYKKLPLQSREDVFYGYPFNGFRGLTSEQYLHLINSIKPKAQLLSYLSDSYEVSYTLRKSFLLELNPLLQAFYSKLMRELIELDVNEHYAAKNAQETDLTTIERRLKGYFTEQEMAGDTDV